MLYTKPTTDITWDDVEAFCAEGITENAYLDYKADFPKDLEKVISAMANTFGGLIIIGVAEDTASKPVTPIAGIDFRKGLAERVTQKIIGNILPPVFPEIVVCRDESEAKAIVVIRIPESDRTPHAIAKNTKVYLRTGNVTTPYELATVDHVEWLKDRRQRAVELREELFATADERFQRVYNLERPRWAAGYAKINPYPGGGWLTLTACPLFPHDMLANPPTLRQRYADIQVDDQILSGGRLPMPSYVPKTYAEGCINFAELSSDVYYVDLNAFGGYFYRQSVYPPLEGTEPVIYFQLLLRIVDRWCESAARYYDLLGFRGGIRLTFHLTCTNWYLMPSPAPEGPCPYRLDRDVRYAETILVGTLRDQSRDFIKAAGERVGWAYDWSVPDDVVDNFLEENPIGNG